VQATNGNLQGVKSATMRVTIPLAQAAPSPVIASAPLIAEIPVEQTNGNGAGYRNGNGAHARV
jgi:hypothetical protein